MRLRDAGKTGGRGSEAGMPASDQFPATSRNRLQRLGAAVAATVLVVLATPLTATAAGDGNSFGVSAPSQSISLKPGESTDTWVGISNQTDKPLTLVIRSATLVPRDDGKFETIDQPDPSWAKNLQFEPQHELAAGTGLHVPVHISMPANAVPDVYIIGFLVEPAFNPTPGAVNVRNQISTFITAEVPGKRHPGVKLLWSHLPSLRFDRNVKGSFRVKNVGGNTTTVRGQVRIDSWRGTNVAVLQATGDQPALLPRGTARTVSYHWKAAGLFFVGRTHVEIDYPNGTAQMQAIRTTGPLMVVVPPQTLAIPPVVAILLVVWRARVRRRRRLLEELGHGPRPQPRAAPRPVATAAAARPTSVSPRPRKPHHGRQHAGRARRKR